MCECKNVCMYVCVNVCMYVQQGNALKAAFPCKMTKQTQTWKIKSLVFKKNPLDPKTDSANNILL